MKKLMTGWRFPCEKKSDIVFKNSATNEAIYHPTKKSALWSNTCPCSKGCKPYKVQIWEERV